MRRRRTTHDVYVPRHALADTNALLPLQGVARIVPVLAATGGCSGRSRRSAEHGHRRTGIGIVLAHAQPLQVAVALVQTVASGAVVAAAQRRRRPVQ